MTRQFFFEIYNHLSKEGKKYPLPLSRQIQQIDHIFTMPGKTVLTFHANYLKGDNLHELSVYFLGRLRKIFQNIIF